MTDNLSNKYLWKFDMCFLSSKVPLIQLPTWRWQKQSVCTHSVLQTLHVLDIKLLVRLSGRLLAQVSLTCLRIWSLNPNLLQNQKHMEDLNSCSVFLMNFYQMSVFDFNIFIYLTLAINTNYLRKPGCSLTEPYLDCWHWETHVHGPAYNKMQAHSSCLK